jgi:hypothetical protein
MFYVMLPVLLLVMPIVYLATSAILAVLPRSSRVYAAATRYEDVMYQLVMTTVGPIRKRPPKRRTGPRKRRLGAGLRKIIVLMILAHQAEHEMRSSERKMRFDSDSSTIGIDNRCSRTISGFIDDFIGPLRDTKQRIQGFYGAETRQVKIGTIRLQWDDDDGARHEFKINNAVYVPGCNVRLLSPQHWAQSLKDSTGQTGCWTNHKESVLRWNKGKSVKTVPIDDRYNVSTFELASGYNKYMNFLAQNQL